MIEKVAMTTVSFESRYISVCDVASNDDFRFRCSVNILPGVYFVTIYRNTFTGKICSISMRHQDAKSLGTLKHIALVGSVSGRVGFFSRKPNYKTEELERIDRACARTLASDDEVERLYRKCSPKSSEQCHGIYTWCNTKETYYPVYIRKTADGNIGYIEINF